MSFLVCLNLLFITFDELYSRLILSHLTLKMMLTSALMDVSDLMLDNLTSLVSSWRKMLMDTSPGSSCVTQDRVKRRMDDDHISDHAGTVVASPQVSDVEPEADVVLIAPHEGALVTEVTVRSPPQSSECESEAENDVEHGHKWLHGMGCVSSHKHYS